MVNENQSKTKTICHGKNLRSKKKKENENKETLPACENVIDNHGKTLLVVRSQLEVIEKNEETSLNP